MQNEDIQDMLNRILGYIKDNGKDCEYEGMRLRATKYRIDKIASLEDGTLLVDCLYRDISKIF